MTAFQAWVASLTMFVLGAACQVLAVVFPALAIPLLSAGTALLGASNVRTILAGPAGASTAPPLPKP